MKQKKRNGNKEILAEYEYTEGWRQAKTLVQQEKQNKELYIARIYKHNPMHMLLLIYQ